MAITYAVVAWLLIQAASILLPTFEAPAWVMKAFVVFLAFWICYFGDDLWAFEATLEGLKRTEDVPADGGEIADVEPTEVSHVRVIVVALFLAAGLLAFSLFRSKLLARSTTVAVSPISQKSIAVLPFENLSDDKGAAYFADGIQDEILTKLAEHRRFESDLAHFDREIQEQA